MEDKNIVIGAVVLVALIGLISFSFSGMVVYKEKDFYTLKIGDVVEVGNKAMILSSVGNAGAIVVNVNG